MVFRLVVESVIFSAQAPFWTKLKELHSDLSVFDVHLLLILVSVLLFLLSFIIWWKMWERQQWSEVEQEKANSHC